MRIGIDARLIQETGVGRYIRNLLSSLADIDKKNEYIVFLPSNAYAGFIIPNERWQKRLITVHWHTMSEQILLPFLFSKEKLDLLHVPYFTVPLFYPGKIVTTIHDITILHFRTGKSTTLPFGLYFLKWIAYRIILSLGIKKSVAILTVSQTVKQELKRFLQVPEEKITVTYEGVDPVFLHHTSEKPILSYPYFLYVGNVYPHKQAEFLIESYQIFSARFRKGQSKALPKLVFVGKQDFFYQRLQKVVKEMNLLEDVIFLNQQSDDALRNLYRHTRALVFPSLGEGFGLPALEALAQKKLVLVSDIPVFHELLEENAKFIPHDRKQWANAFYDVSKYLQSDLQITNLDALLERYSWKTLANTTKDVYEDSTRI